MLWLTDVGSCRPAYRWACVIDWRFRFFLPSLVLTCFTTMWRNCSLATPRCHTWRNALWWNRWCSSVTSSRTLQSRRLFSMSWWPQWLQTGRRRRWDGALWALYISVCNLSSHLKVSCAVWLLSPLHVSVCSWILPCSWPLLEPTRWSASKVKIQT